MNNENILLIKPYSELSNVLPPLGLGYLSTALKRSGISVKILHCYKDKISIKEVTEFIKKQNVRIVGVTCCSNDHFWLSELSEHLKLLRSVYLIVGGPHATGLSTRLFGLIPRINFIVKSEGELSLPILAKLIYNNSLSDNSLSGVPNLVWRNSEGCFIENEIKLTSDLDSLSMPDWAQISPEEYSKFTPHGGFSRVSPVAQILTTRGCPYNCRYCASGLMNGKVIRKRTPENIIEEIQYLIRNHGVKEVHIEDDNFTFYKEHALSICAAIRKNKIKLNFGLPNGIRVDSLDEEILKELNQSGFYFFSIGIESGSATTLKRMNKQLSLEKVMEKVKLIRKYHFRLKGFFMLGYPGETAKDMLETIDFALQLGLDQAFFSIYIPLPGTAEFSSLEKEGKIDISKCNWQDYYTGKFSLPPYSPEGVSAVELRKMISFAYKKFYFRPKILAKLLLELASLEQARHIARRVGSLIKRN